MNKLSKFIRSIELRIRYVWFGIKRINKPHIGDIVHFNGMRCLLIQGASEPLWTMVSDNGTKFQMIHEDKFTLSYSISSIINRIISDYHFLMTYWYYEDIKKKGKISYNGF